jgi:hypothetical protein
MGVFPGRKIRVEVCQRTDCVPEIVVLKPGGRPRRQARRADARRRDVQQETGGSFEKNGWEQGDQRRGGPVKVPR